MKIRIKLKSFEEIASVSAPKVMYFNDKYIIMLENLGYKNFNQQDGKYLFDPETMIPLLDKELVVEYCNIESKLVYDLKDYEYKVTFGLWMVNILGKVQE